MSEKTTELRKSRDNNKKRGQVTLLVLCVFLFSLIFYLIGQNYNISQRIDVQQAREDKEAKKRLEKALEENQKEHKKTQAYVKCIGQVLLKPIEERTDTEFDSCSLTDVSARPNNKTATENTGLDTEATNSTPNRTPLPLPQQPIVDQPPTQAPPAPEESTLQKTAKRIGQGVKNLVTDITNFLGGK